ncbi:MAG: coniferyl aldehyde dehydrogenase [Gammaproteobacteria bacterium]|uniref:Aldehyde dehydrogenase n=1 Tax=SAR86 cluster bacterium TaxID=2030880 RepID=A0A520N117_9GAMM|nr:MAG: coniferyl aldehyde dehydrogenase [SAR86 cluster bacterium]
MREILEIQRKAFLEEGEPSLNQRIDRLKRCIALIETHDEKIINALNNDFKNRSKGEILTSEISQSVRNLNFTIKKLKKWMKPQSRPSSFMANMLGSKSILKPSPLGTVGVIAPWNFPVGMVFYPAASIFAAGNRIMAKPSELTPNTADVIKEGVEKYFDESEFSVTLGGPEVGAEFSALPFDHLLYTGSGRVGKKILAAAANNLVPTTLELGGKSPTIISDGMDLNLIAKRIMFVKTLNAGQICLSPDYIFIKRGLENDLINGLKETFNDFFTEKNQDDYTSMVNENHFKRMDQYIQDAKEKGAVVTDLAPIDNPENNIMSTKVLLNVNDEMLVMQEEIFGPLLPVMVYDDLSEVVNYVNDHDHPLGLYFFGDDKKEQEFIINNTRSGGVTINDVMFHLMQSELPFGGVGPSGNGHYHGYEGFLNFSNLRSIYYQTKIDTIFNMLRPPRKKSFEMLSKIMKKLS